MIRVSQWSLASVALLTAVACADSDRKNLEQQAQNGTLSLGDVQLQTREDTPVSGVAPVQSFKGTLTTQVINQGTKGTLTFGPAGTSFTYTPNHDANGDDTVVVAVSDATAQARATVHVTITPVDDPPALSGDTTLIMDEDSVLNISLSNVIVVDDDSTPSQLTLTLLPSALYISNGNTLRPLPNFNGDLQVFVMLYDGTSSDVAELSVTVRPINDPPVNTVPPPQRTPVDTPFTFTGDLAPRVSDVDSGDAPLSVTLSANHGTLALATTDGLTFTTGTGTGDATVVFSGSQTAITAALAGLVVTPPSSFNDIITLTLTTNDQGATGSGGALSDSDTFALGVGSVDLPPFNTLNGTAAVNEDDTLVFGGGANPIGVVDSDPADTTGQVTLSVDVGTLTLSTTDGLSFTNGSGTADDAMAFSGSLTAINAALTGMIYTPSPDFAGTVTLSMTSQTNLATDTDTMVITVNALNDPPVVSGPTSATTLSTTDIAFTGVNVVTIGDVDASTGSMHLAITVTGGTVALATVASITPTTDTGTSYVADGTRLDLNTALAGLVFHPGAGTSASITIVINDNGFTGAGGAESDELDIAISITVPNQPPVAAADTYQTSGNTTLVVATTGAGVLANDHDDDGAHTVTLTTTGDIDTTLHGTVHLAADGTFTYDPPLGTGNTDDTFSYTIKDSDNATTDGTATINIGRAIWYVSGGAAGGGTGRDGAPFQTIAAALAAAGNDSTIYVAGDTDPYAGGIILGGGQQLIGAGVDLTRNGNPTITATGNPTITGNGGGSTPVITVPTAAQVRGITIAPSTPQSYPGINIVGGSTTIADVEIHNQTPQVAIAVANGTVSLTRVKLIDAGGDAVNITGPAAANVTTVTIASSTINGTTLGNGILARTSGGSIVLSVDTVTFEHIDTNGIDIASVGGASSVHLTCHGSGMQNDDTSALGDTAIRVVASGSAATAIADVDTTFIDGWAGTGIALQADGGGTSLTSTLTSNTIGSAIAGSLALNGISVELDADDTISSATGIVLLDNNALTLTAAGAPGIELFTRQGAAHTLDVTLTDNTITTVTADGVSVTSDPGATVCSDFENDTASGGFHLNATTGTIHLPNYSGGDVQTYFNNQTNTGNVTATGTIAGTAACLLPPS